MFWAAQRSWPIPLQEALEKGLRCQPDWEDAGCCRYSFACCCSCRDAVQTARRLGSCILLTVLPAQYKCSLQSEFAAQQLQTLP